MSSPLDRIEAAAKATYWHGEELDIDSADVLALVNVAKAAEYAEDELRKYGTGVPLIGARHRLYDALAALNKEPA